MTTALLPAGFHDRLPPHADAMGRIEAAVLGAARLHGYERADPPLAEFLDGLAGRLKVGGARDAVRFVDPLSQRTLAIRPDITAQIGRIVASRMAPPPAPGAAELCRAGAEAERIRAGASTRAAPDRLRADRPRYRGGRVRDRRRCGRGAGGGGRDGRVDRFHPARSGRDAGRRAAADRARGDPRTARSARCKGCRRSRRAGAGLSAADRGGGAVRRGA